MTPVAALSPCKPRGPAFVAVALSALLAAPVHAQTTPRIAVTEIKPLLVLAAERGSAHGVLTGPGADYVRQRFAAATPIEIDVRALHALPQGGCSRLEVVTRQRDVLEQGRRGDQALTYQLNFCRDGRPPSE